MGCVSSMMGVPEPPEIDPEEVAKIVIENTVDLLKDSYKKFGELKELMKKKHPKPHKVEKEETLDVEVELLEGRDDDKKVLKVAVTITAVESFKDKVKDAVWEQIEKQVEPKIGDVPEIAKKACLKAAHKACDKLVEKALDKAIEEIHKKIEKGEGEGEKKEGEHGEHGENGEHGEHGEHAAAAASEGDEEKKDAV